MVCQKVEYEHSQQPPIMASFCGYLKQNMGHVISLLQNFEAENSHDLLASCISIHLKILLLDQIMF